MLPLPFAKLTIAVLAEAMSNVVSLAIVTGPEFAAGSENNVPPSPSLANSIAPLW